MLHASELSTKRKRQMVKIMGHTEKNVFQEQIHYKTLCDSDSG